MHKSDAVIFFRVLVLDLLAKPRSLENHVAVTHFLLGLVMTFTGTYSIPLQVTTCSMVAMRGEGTPQYPCPPATNWDNVLE